MSETGRVGAASSPPAVEKVKIRGLVRGAGWIFLVWGVTVAVKGLLDAFILSPESEFVPMAKWVKYAGFEVAYGLACCTVSGLLFEFSKRVKDHIERPRVEREGWF